MLSAKSPVDQTFLASTLCKEGEFFDIKQLGEWLDKKRQQNHFLVEQIPLKNLTQWHFDKQTGNLIHNSGRFFAIEGLSVTWLSETRLSKTGTSEKEITWQQPIINQPEIGILGIITCVVGGVRYFLMQAKMEPGNIGFVQLSPTVQATESNFSRVHQGAEPPYLHYFLDRTKSRILIDQIHSEQGGRFYRKRNRNIIVEIPTKIKINENFCWLTLGQINAALKQDNVVNLDSRSVLSCVPCFEINPSPKISDDIILSMQSRSETLRSFVDVVSWIAKIKNANRLTTELMPLNEVKGWVINENEIKDSNNEFFSILAVKVHADNREVSSWDQPLIKSISSGLLGFVTKKINGILHFLVHAKVEVGNMDVVEIAPTVSCSNYLQKYQNKKAIPFLDLFIAPAADRIKYCAYQSEEGGRFYQLQNKNIVIEVEPDQLNQIPADFEWLTLYQMAELQRRGFLNIDARTLLTCVRFSLE